MSDASVLVIEDDTSRARNLQELLEFADFESLIVSAPDAISWSDRSRPDWLAALVRESNAPGGSVLSSLRRHDSNLPVIMLGDRAESDHRGDKRICGQIPLPLKYPCLIEALERARRWRTESHGIGRAYPVGGSLAIQELDRLIQQVAEFDSTVLITGESGTGKELVARRIHELSSRAEMPFVPLNCGAIPRELLESELFGHEKGAFTGAISRRIGRFELADGGTLFLDEIGDMSIDMQVKLLRIVQERTFERLGSTVTKHANVRILAATHRNLEDRIAAREFREDLYFRLNVFPIRVPPLRERIDDLPVLISDLLVKGNGARKSTLTFSEPALQRLRDYEWPGNVRELANVIERAAIMCASGFVEVESLPRHIVGSQQANPYSDVMSLPEEGLDLRSHLGRIEKELIRRALDESNGTVAQAARLLNLRRTTLVEKLRKHNLTTSNSLGE